MVSDYLSPSERLECMKAGALLRAADYDRAGVKSAGVASNAFSLFETGARGVDSAALLVSALLGVPVGIAAHSIARSVDGKRFEEEKMRQKINLYKDFASDMRRGVGA